MFLLPLVVQAQESRLHQNQQQGCRKLKIQELCWASYPVGRAQQRHRLRYKPKTEYAHFQ